jgi:Zn ribbon nucleic-acid-binding protein
MRKKKRRRPSYTEREVGSYQPLTECFCPRCETKHLMRMNWIGNGIPRKFCEACRHTINYGNPDEDEFLEDDYQLHLDERSMVANVKNKSL